LIVDNARHGGTGHTRQTGNFFEGQVVNHLTPAPGSENGPTTLTYYTVEL
jgi:hypothetical protein